MCAFSSASSSSPGWDRIFSAIWFAIDAVGRYTASSCPSNSAARRSSSSTVGSSRFCSSPTTAAAIAARMPALGRVAVSERRSIIARRLAAAHCINDVLYRRLMEPLAALADPTRRRILELLAEAERDAGEIGSHFDVSQPAISRHLRVLRETGLVRVRPEAQRRLYSLDPKP